MWTGIGGILAESWRRYIQPRVSFIIDVEPAAVDDAGRPDVRTASEHIGNIRNVLNPTIADLASVFGVSRQAIYKWLSGAATPEPDKVKRIIEFSNIADAFQAAKVSRASSLLKMKAFAGQSLLDLIKSGQNGNEHIDALISEAKLMESAYKHSGLATSKSRPTSNWKSSVSIPGSPESI